MKRNLNQLLFLMFLGLMGFSNASFAQTTVSGQVIDQENGETLIGVNISIKGTVTGTISDLDGTFELRTNTPPPFTVVFSYTGYASQEVEVAGDKSDLKIEMATASIIGNDIVVSASRMEERTLQSPVTIEKLDLVAIRTASAPDFFDAMETVKGVTTVKGSMTFTAINTRGFGAAANERFVQLIDGVDIAAPLLNFPMGNLIGISELDVRSVELVPGAASALYGPNAFNGILMMNSKNPFKFQGLSAQVKLGLTNSDAQDGAKPYTLASLRYAKSFLNDKLALKLNGSVLNATDWLADDYATGRTSATRPIPAKIGDADFDGVNLYGDEAEIFVPMSVLATPLSNALAPLFAPQLNITEAQAQGLLEMTIPNLPPLNVRRTGLKEQDLLNNNDAKSYKFDGALHYRLTEKLEASYNYRYGTGSSVYQGGERYVLRGFKMQMHKLELNGSNFFVRGYFTHTDDGDSYNLSALGGFANERFKGTASAWLPTYAGTYAGALLPILLQGGSPTAEQVAGANAAGRTAADAGIPAAGTDEFNKIVDAVRNDLFQGNPEGAGFIDDSKLYHAEFNYNLRDLTDILDIQVGGNVRRYDIFSGGTIFNEDPDGDGKNERITIDEYGIYTQIGKSFVEDRLKLAASFRYDKNENFDGQVTPRVSMVYSAGKNKEHNIRASFQTGFRNPSTQQQYIFFPLSSGTLVGSTEANASRYKIHNGGAYSNASYLAFVGSALAGAPNPGLLKEINIPYVKPEQLTAFELGYKALINNKVLLDLNVYHNIYKDFMTQVTVRAKEGITNKGKYFPGVNDVLTGQATSGSAFRLYTNSNSDITSTGFGLGWSASLAKNYRLYGNYVYSTFDIQNKEEGFEPGFNMPKNMIVFGVANQKVVKNLGFDINFRWQDEFEWQNSFAYGTIPAYNVLNASVSYTIPKAKTVVKLGGTNLLGNDYKTNAGGPRIGQMIYISMTYDQFMN